jgi:hypothetical protein
MISQMVAYKAELNQRYWDYQKSQFPKWQQFFDRPQTQKMRPPVFRRDEAWRNVIARPNGSQQEINKLLAFVPEGDRHKWFGSMNSSQALAQSVLGNLAIYGLLSELSELHDDEGLALFGKAQLLPDNFAMEYKIDYLGEPRRTSLDGYLEGGYRVALECKFTEAEVGSCSRPRLKPIDSNYCDGTYTMQKARNARCSLTEVGVLYWRYIPQLFLWNNNKDLMPCPMAANYQLVRNILAIGVTPNGDVSLTRGHVALIYDERNPAFQRDGTGFAAFMDIQRALREPTMLRKCSWQRITEHLRSKGVLTWLTEQLELKYGL